MKKILFVCTGNTCRSSMAEAILKNDIGKIEKLKSEYNVASAGIAAFTGDEASPNAISALKELWNIDLSCHRSRKLNEYDFEASWLVLTMTLNHKEFILSRFPEISAKLFTLKEFVNNCSDNPDIDDPYNKDLFAYKSSANEIKEAIDLLIIKLLS